MAHSENLASQQLDRANGDDKPTAPVEEVNKADPSEHEDLEPSHEEEPPAPVEADVDTEKTGSELESPTENHDSLTEVEIGPTEEVERPSVVKLDPPDNSAQISSKAPSEEINGSAQPETDKHLVEVPPELPKFEKVIGLQKQGMVRHIVAVLALSSIVLANMNRQVFNQALVTGMTVTKAPDDIATEPSIVIPEEVDPIGELTTVRTRDDIDQMPVSEADMVQDAQEQIQAIDDDRYDWSAGQISTLQAAFSYGYMPFMILGGRLSELYGAKWVVFVSGFGSALCCIFLPFLANSNFWLLVASRVLMGLCQTGVSPALYALLTRWLPQEEASVYLPMIKVGVMVGYMCGSLVVGFFPWRLTFYMTGLIGLLWCALWVVMVTSDPGDHRLLGAKELEYIRWEIRRANKGRQQSLGEARKRAAPWLNILTNPVVLAFMFTKFTVKLSTDAQAMQIPMYLQNVFKVSKELNGVLSAINFALQGIFTGLVAWTAKEFGVRKVLGFNKTGTRRLFQGVNSFGMAAAYILMTFNMSSLGFVTFTVIMVSVSSMFGAGGEAVTPVDLSTEYPASIMAIANSLANTSGIVLPPLITFILNDKLDSADNWNLAWRILGGIVVSGGIVYTCFVTAELQDFTSAAKEKARIEKEKAQEVVIEMKTKSSENEEPSTSGR